MSIKLNINKPSQDEFFENNAQKRNKSRNEYGFNIDKKYKTNVTERA